MFYSVHSTSGIRTDAMSVLLVLETQDIQIWGSFRLRYVQTDTHGHVNVLMMTVSLKISFRAIS